MLMFLTILAASLFAMAILSLTSLGLSPDEERMHEVKPGLEIPMGAARFFGDSDAAPAGAGVPIEVLLSQLEQHVRIEQAAAETFLAMPTRERLNASSTSPLIN